MGQKGTTLQSFNEILSVPYFEGADFNSQIGFWKFRFQMSKFGHSGSKSINFLILMKFCMYPISKVLTSNPTFVFKNFERKSAIWGLLILKLILTRSRTYPISTVLISNLTLVFENLESKSPKMGILVQKVSNLSSWGN